MLDHKFARLLILSHRSQRMTLKRNTHLYESGSSYRIELHGNTVVQINDNDTWLITTGGFRTVTTKERINRFSPARIYQQAGEWYATNCGEPVPFFERMLVDRDGCVLNYIHKIKSGELFPS